MSYTVRTIVGSTLIDLARYRTFKDAIESAMQAIEGIPSYAGRQLRVVNPELVHIANSDWEALSESPPVYSVKEVRWMQLKVLRESAGSAHRGTTRGMSQEQ